MNLRRFLIRLFLGLVPMMLVGSVASGQVLTSSDPSPTAGLQCGRALAQWNAVAFVDLSFKLLSVRPSTASPAATPTTGGVVLVEVVVENGRDQAVTLKATQFILTDCRNGTAPALSCVSGPTVQPLAFAPVMDEQATNVARANAVACQTLPMLIGQSVPSHGRLQGWIAFPSWIGAQPRLLEYLVINAGTRVESTIRCRLVDAGTAMPTPEATACNRAKAPTAASPTTS